MDKYALIKSKKVKYIFLQKKKREGVLYQKHVVTCCILDSDIKKISLFGVPEI